MPDISMYRCVFTITPVLKIDKKEDIKARVSFYAKINGNEMSWDAGYITIRPSEGDDIITKSYPSISSPELGMFIKRGVFDAAVCDGMGWGEKSVDSVSKYNDMLSSAGVSGIVKSGMKVKDVPQFLSAIYYIASPVIMVDEKLIESDMNNELLNGLEAGRVLSYIMDRGRGGEAGVFLSDVNGTCQNLEAKIENTLFIFSHTIKTAKLYSCLKDSNAYECIKYIDKGYGNQKNGGLSTIRIFVDGKMLKNNAKVCRDSSIRIEYENINTAGETSVIVNGNGAGNKCENEIIIYGDGEIELNADEFLCNGRRPFDGDQFLISVKSNSEIVGTKRVIYRDVDGECSTKQVFIRFRE